MSTRVSVLEFVVLAERSVRALRRFVDSELSLVRAKNSGLVQASGSVGSVEYRFHGRGCAMTLDTGEEVDFDLDSADRPMFDV
jgi:hypothetical protein